MVGRALLRLVSLLLGIVFFAASVMVRTSGRVLTADNWQIHLRLSPNASDLVSLPFAVLPALLLLAGAGFLLNPAVRATLGRVARKRWAAGVLAVFALTLLPLSPATTDQQIVVYLLLGSLGTLLLLVALGPVLQLTVRPLKNLWKVLLTLPSPVFALLLALFVFAIANWISWRVFSHMPHSHDTVAQLFQARLFALGRLFLPSMPAPQFFDEPFIINDGRWYSVYPPGHPAILALGVLFRAPWLVNPLLGALAVAVIYALGRELYDEPTARLGALLASLSPFLLLMSSEFMNHASSLLLCSLFLLFSVRALRNRTETVSRSAIRLPHSVNALLAGLSIGLAASVRPYTALLIAVPVAGWAGFRLLRRREWVAPALMVAGGVVGLLPLLAYNHLTNGSPFLFGYAVKYGPGFGLGFGLHGWGESYTLTQALVATSTDLNALNRCVFEFPVPALIFPALLFLTPARDRRDWFLLATFAALVGGYCCYWFHALNFGPRWEYEALPALALLSARGLRAFPGSVPGIEPDRIRSRLVQLLLVGYTSTFLIALPAQCAIHSSGKEVSALTGQTIDRAGLKNAVVLARRYDEVFLKNQFPPGGDVIYARDLGGLNPLLERSNPGRRFLLAHRSSLRELSDINFETSPLKEDLDRIAVLLNRTDLTGFRTLIIPAAELADCFPFRQPAVMSYRDLARAMTTDLTALDSILPALAIWVRNDESDYPAEFKRMNRGDDFNLGLRRFTRRGAGAHNCVLLYEVR